MRKTALKFISMVLLSLMLTGVFAPAQATDKKEIIAANEDYLYRISLMGDIQILRYIGEERKVQIPEKIDGKYVVSIGECAFMGLDITSVTMPMTISHVSSDAFYDCVYLKEVTIPEGVTFLDNVFRNCKSLTTVNFDQYASSLGKGMFYGCTSLKSISLPDGIKVIPEDTFAGCTALTQVDFPKRLTTIGKRAFYKSGLEDFPSDLENLTAIGESAFACCGFKEVNLPQGVKLVAAESFANCPNLEYVKLPSSLYRIDHYAFSENPKLKTLDYPTVNRILLCEDTAFALTPLAKTELVLSLYECYTFYFYIPDSWISGYSTIYACWKESPEDTYPTLHYYGQSTNTPGVYSMKVPKGVTEIVFRSRPYLLDANGKLLPVYSPKTVTIDLCGYEKGEKEYYPLGLESFDGMIYVLGNKDALNNRDNAKGEWFYYYGDGYYGFLETPDWNSLNIFSGSTTKVIYSSSCSPTEPTVEIPTLPTEHPKPTVTESPSMNPDDPFIPVTPTEPNYPPTECPTEAPSECPTETPTYEPTQCPTEAPSTAPTEAPTYAPTEAPTYAPTEAPTYAPTCAPTEAPTCAPTMCPTEMPTEEPTETPSEGGSEAPPTSDSTLDEPTTNPNPDTDLQTEEILHRESSYSTLREKLDVWEKLGWDVRIRGDVNSDLKVNVRDATLIQKHLASLPVEGAELKNADVNTDGKVNIRDATMIQKKVAGLISSFD